VFARKAAVIAFAILFSSIAVRLALPSTTAPQHYSGNKISFETWGGYLIELQSNSPIYLKATSKEYFQLTKGQTVVRGEPQLSPLGYKTAYFLLEEEGSWELKGPTVIIEVKGESLNVTCKPLPLGIIKKGTGFLPPVLFLAWLGSAFLLYSLAPGHE